MSTKHKEQELPPPASVLIATYGFLGGALSYFCGRTPAGVLPEHILAELCPSLIVICIFLSLYEVYDVMGVGIAKMKVKGGYYSKQYDDIPAKAPEAVWLAQRAQMNQVEQLVPFIISTLCFSILVNGMIGGLLAMVWSVLRVMYASTYRNSVGVVKKPLAKYTIPCYFIIGTMLMGSVVHACRWMML